MYNRLYMYKVQSYLKTASAKLSIYTQQIIERDNFIDIYNNIIINTSPFITIFDIESIKYEFRSVFIT